MEDEVGEVDGNSLLVMLLISNEEGFGVITDHSVSYVIFVIISDKLITATSADPALEKPKVYHGQSAPAKLVTL